MNLGGETQSIHNNPLLIYRESLCCLCVFEAHMLMGIQSKTRDPQKSGS